MSQGTENRLPIALNSFITKTLSTGVYLPPLSMSNIMDSLFSGENWWDFDYETIVTSVMNKLGIQIAPVSLAEIQAISAIRGKKSFVDKEWHLFEKLVLALTGAPVFFFEKQNIPIEYVLFAVRVMKILGKSEFSEEVKYYIATETLNDEILWYPDEFIDSCLQMMLSMSGKTLGLDMEEVSSVRKATERRFNELKSTSFESMLFDEKSIPDMMCARVLRSLAIYKGLIQHENEFLSHLDALKNGKVEQEGISDAIKDVLSPKPESEKPIDEIVAANAVSNMAPIDFEDDEFVISPQVKEAAMAEIKDFVDMVTNMRNGDSVKIASHMSPKIRTGVPIHGQETDKDGPMNELEKTFPIADCSAEEAVTNALETSGSSGTDELATDKDNNKIIDIDDKDETGMNIFMLD